MTEKNRIISTSVAHSNSFIRYWTGLSTPTIWLEADEKADGTWNVCAIGTSEVSREGGKKNLKNFLSAEKSITEPYLPQEMQEIASKSHDGYPISVYQSNMVAKEISFADALAYMIFFESQNRNERNDFFDTKMYSFRKLQELRSYRNFWDSHHRKPRP